MRSRLSFPKSIHEYIPLIKFLGKINPNEDNYAYDAYGAQQSWKLAPIFFQKIQHIYFPWLSGYNAEVFSTTGLKLLLWSNC